jgi:hypothetical protein
VDSALGQPSLKDIQVAFCCLPCLVISLVVDFVIVLLDPLAFVLARVASVGWAGAKGPRLTEGAAFLHCEILVSASMSASMRVGKGVAILFLQKHTATSSVSKSTTTAHSDVTWRCCTEQNDKQELTNLRRYDEPARECNEAFLRWV